MDATKSSRNGSTLNILIYAASAIPFLLSMVFHGIAATPRKPLQPVDRPALSFDQYLVHLGNVPLRQMYFARFRFTNRSDRTVKIRDLKPSCGCLNPKLEKTEYKPGESGEFYLQLQTATEKPGPNEYYCDVRYEDGEQRTTRVTFKVNLPDKTVVVRPAALIFYQRSDKVTTHKISVTDFRANKRLQLVDVDCSSDLVKVALGEIEVDAEGNRVQPVFVRVGSVPPGRRRAMVTILTDDAEFAELKVPLLIEGRTTASDRISVEHDHSQTRK